MSFVVVLEALAFSVLFFYLFIVFVFVKLGSRTSSDFLVYFCSYIFGP